MTDADLKKIDKRLASLPAGPWRWSRNYGLDHGDHWCLENRDSAVNGATIDHYCVTYTTQEETNFTDDGRTVTVCDTPVMSFLADSRALVDALLAEVRQLREVFLNDYLGDSLALRLAHRAGQEVMRERIVSALKENNLDTTAMLVSKVEAIDP